MKSVGSCYLFFNISSHRHTVGKGTCELFQVGFGYITSPSPRRLRCIKVIVFYRRRGYRRRMQLLLVGGMHCSVLMLMLMLLKLDDRLILYLYIFISIFYVNFILFYFIIIRRCPRLSFGMHSLGENNGNPNTRHSIYYLECVHPI